MVNLKQFIKVIPNFSRYNNIIKDFKDFKQNVRENNEDIKDKYLLLEAFIRDDRKFSKLNRRGFFQLKIFPYYLIIQ